MADPTQPEMRRPRGSDRRAPQGESKGRGTKARKPPRRPTVVGVLGELLITAGVLVLLFLGWQMWWNNLVVDNQQSSAAATQSQQWLQDALKAPKPTPTPDANGAVDIPVMAQPADYEAFAVLYIPRLGADWKRTIRQTVDVEKVLNSYTAGVGHYSDTQMPGQVGNFAVAGHDSGWGNTFIDLSKLHIGDKIYVQTKDGWYTYVFRNFEYVQPSAVQVLLPVPRQPAATPTERLMTITTCNPPFAAGERLIAYNVFDSYAPAQDVPSELAGVPGLSTSQGG
ncbi:class E sortase [Leifsonia aquatica]|uniref:class E sortase n=1 Tax=Leifsonia aquatica TaxID=144185 RepID=UPI000AF260A4|nr:class E sortase [Leifsonia aquatica]